MFGKMTRPQQLQLSDTVLAELQRFQAVHQLEPRQLIYWLVSFTWGYAKRLGWAHQEIASYALSAFDACDKTFRSSGGGRDLLPPE